MNRTPATLLAKLYGIDPPRAVYYMGLEASGRYPSVDRCPGTLWLLERGDTVQPRPKGK